jgi:hypothetical protein
VSRPVCKASRPPAQYTPQYTQKQRSSHLLSDPSKHALHLSKSRQSSTMTASESLPSVADVQLDTALCCAWAPCSLSQFAAGRAFPLCPCRTVRYCGKEHQTLDWKGHKAICQSQRATIQRERIRPSGIRPELSALDLAELMGQFT